MVELTTWDQALSELDGDDATPAYVARLGSIDARGIEAGTKHAARAVNYVTKYITKDIADDAAPASDPQQAHLDRLYAELAVLPCSPTCANWLLYGIQPRKVRQGLVSGRCSGKVHQSETLGYTGRRVLISRNWTGKTLTDHRHDNRDHIRRLLAVVDIQDQAATADPGRYEYQTARPGDPDVPPYNTDSCTPSPPDNAGKTSSTTPDRPQHHHRTLFRQPHHRRPPPPWRPNPKEAPPSMTTVVQLHPRTSRNAG